MLVLVQNPAESLVSVEEFSSQGRYYRLQYDSSPTHYNLRKSQKTWAEASHAAIYAFHAKASSMQELSIDSGEERTLMNLGVLSPFLGFLGLRDFPSHYSPATPDLLGANRCIPFYRLLL